MFKWAASINPKPAKRRWSITGFRGRDDDADRASRIEDAKRGIIRVGRM
jgi:hypothetical protein